MNVATAAQPLDTLVALLDDIGALKRVRRAGSPYSVATTLFLRAWRRAVALDDIGEIAREMTAEAVVASRLGAIDAPILEAAGIDAADRLTLLQAAFDAAAVPLDASTRASLRLAVRAERDTTPLDDAPHFARMLAEQPRAGATAPGAPRLILEPPESHADHCFAVCVYAMLVAPRYATDGEDAFVLGLSHHLHNAFLPDSGFAGEILLGDHLETIVERFTQHALATVPDRLAQRIRMVRHRLLPSANEPQAQAFHAADVIDRVLQARHYARVAAFELTHALDDLELVHAGPVQHFHAGVLAEAGLP